MSIDQDISKVLTYQIKREIAERYFGFRKLIEDDKAALLQRITDHARILERIRDQDLARICLLLKDDYLITSFLNLAGLSQKILTLSSRQDDNALRSLLQDEFEVWGFSLASRFRKLVYKCYEGLYHRGEKYRQGYAGLMEERELINEEIHLFSQRHDLGEIMGFLRSLEAVDTPGNSIAGSIEHGVFEDLDRKMRIDPLPSLEKYLPFLPSLSPPEMIHKMLNRLADQALKLHGHALRNII